MVSSLLIKQPLNLLIKPEETEARLDCHHGDSSYPYMLWYQHKSAAGGRGTMELIGLLQYDKPTMEKNFEARFTITGHSKGQAQLVISNITSTDSAKYFCAARSTVLQVLWLLYKNLLAQYQTCTCIQSEDVVMIVFENVSVFHTEAAVVFYPCSKRTNSLNKPHNYRCTDRSGRLES